MLHGSTQYLLLPDPCTLGSMDDVHGIGPLRVLVADDTDLVRQSVRSVLAQYPQVDLVGEAPDGLAAVEMALVLRPDVVVMDINMPRLNGVEATRRIKASLPNTSVIGFSVQHDFSTQALITEAGAAAFLPKDEACHLPQVIEHVTGRKVVNAPF